MDITMKELDAKVSEIMALGQILQHYLTGTRERREAMPTIKCVCGAVYHGWALNSMICHCDKCGMELNIPDYEIDGEVIAE